MFRLQHRANRPTTSRAPMGVARLCSNRPKVLTRDLLEPIYHSFDSTIKVGVEDAALHNKKLLLLVGEKHDEQDSMLAEIMLLSILKKYFIDNLYVEYTPKLLQRVLKLKKHGIGKYGYDYFTPDDAIFNDHVNTGVLEAYLLMQTEHPMQIIGVDDPRIDQMPLSETITPEMMSQRDSHFIEQFIQHDQNGIGVFGLAHLYGIMSSHELNEKYHIMGVNIVSPQSIQTMLKSHLLDQIDDCITSRVKFACNHSSVWQIPPVAMSTRDPLTVKTEVEIVMQLCEEKHRKQDRRHNAVINRK